MSEKLNRRAAFGTLGALVVAPTVLNAEPAAPEASVDLSPTPQLLKAIGDMNSTMTAMSSTITDLGDSLQAKSEELLDALRYLKAIGEKMPPKGMVVATFERFGISEDLRRECIEEAFAGVDFEEDMKDGYLSRKRRVSIWLPKCYPVCCFLPSNKGHRNFWGEMGLYEHVIVDLKNNKPIIHHMHLKPTANSFTTNVHRFFSRMKYYVYDLKGRNPADLLTIDAMIKDGEESWKKWLEQTGPVLVNIESA